MSRLNQGKLVSASSLVFISLVSALVGAFMYAYFFSAEHKTMPTEEAANTEEKVGTNEPLYWVAPMDDNYRRSKAGKSPMGMDLVPVYAKSGSSKGLVRISSSVINNLGIKKAQVIKGPLVKEIKALGLVKFNEDKMTHIHPRVEGWIESLYVTTNGQTVKKGQPLYQLYSPQLVNAQQEFLLAQQQNSTRLVVAARTRLLALNFNEQAIEKLTQEQKAQQYVTFYAPMDGVVDDLQVQSGFYVRPGTTLMRIAQLDEVWVEAEIYAMNTERVKVGQYVAVSVDYEPGRIWRGQIDFIYPTLNKKTKSLTVRVKLSNKMGFLKPNMYATVDVDLEDKEQRVLVPKSAVIRTGSQNRVVLVIADDQFKSVEVLLGQQNQQYIEVLYGLEPHDTVVVSGQFLIDSESSKSSDFERMVPVSKGKPESVMEMELGDD